MLEYIVCIFSYCPFYFCKVSSNTPTFTLILAIVSGLFFLILDKCFSMLVIIWKNQFVLWFFLVLFLFSVLLIDTSISSLLLTLGLVFCYVSSCSEYKIRLLTEIFTLFQCGKFAGVNFHQLIAFVHFITFGTLCYIFISP